ILCFLGARLTLPSQTVRQRLPGPATGSMSNQLKANSLSFFESLVMGVAGSAPGYTIAVTTAALLATAGPLSPGALVIFAVPMLGVAVSYKALNRRDASAGAA